MLVHAAGESSAIRLAHLPEDTHAIVLSVPDEPALAALAERLAKHGVAHMTIREPDAPWNGALMSIGLVPARREDLKRHLSSLPLLK